MEEHHAGDDAEVVLPAVAELVPPVGLYDLGLVDVADGPEVALLLVEEYGLVDGVVAAVAAAAAVLLGVGVFELVLVVAAVEAHFYAAGVGFVGVGVVHGVEAGTAAATTISSSFTSSSAVGVAVTVAVTVAATPIATTAAAAAAIVVIVPAAVVAVVPLPLGKGNLPLLLVGPGLGAQLGPEAGLVVVLEVAAVGVGDGEVVVEGGAAEDEALAAGGGGAEDAEGVVGEDAEDHSVEGLVRRRRGTMVTAVVVISGGTVPDAEVDGVVGAGEDAVDLGARPDLDAAGLEVAAPGAVEGVQVVKGDHGGEVGQQGLGVVVPELHVGVVEEALDDGAGDAGRLVAGAEEEGDEGVDHAVAEVAGEEGVAEDAQHDADGDEPEKRHGPLDDQEQDAEAPDVTPVPGHEPAGEAVCPEAGFPLAEGDLEGDVARRVAVALEVAEGVLEDVGAALDAVVDPRGAVPGRVEGDRGGLAADHVGFFQERHAELVRVVGEGVGA